MAETDRIAIARRNSGIGDMLSQLVHVLWYSEATRRKCYVDWIDIPNYFDFQTPEMDLFSMFFTSEKIASVATLRQPMGNWSRKSTANQLSGSQLFASALEPSVIEEFACTGHDAGETVAEFRRPLDFLPTGIWSRLIREIRLKDAIKDTIDHPPEALANCIGIHIRHGNGELFDNDGELELFTAYETMIEHVLATTSTKALFLSTDSKAAEDWLGSRLGSFKSNSKFLPDDIGLPIHHPDSTNGYEHASRSGIFRDALRDLYALSQCRYLICDRHGSFTRAAQTWGNFLTEPGRLFQIKSPRKPFLARARSFWEDQNFPN